MDQKVRKDELWTKERKPWASRVTNFYARKFSRGAKMSICLHFSLILEWNLIARSDNIVNLAIGDLEWSDDFLIVFIKVQDRPRGCRFPRLFACLL